MATQPSSEILDLTEASRRSVLKSLAVSGGVVSGINQIAKKVSGETPDGVPLVHTYDSQGNPAQVRYVSKEKKKED